MRYLFHPFKLVFKHLTEMKYLPIRTFHYSLIIHKLDSPSPKNADEQALSETELESRRAALLAQLNEQMEE